MLFGCFFSLIDFLLSLSKRYNEFTILYRLLNFIIDWCASAFNYLREKINT